MKNIILIALVLVLVSITATEITKADYTFGEPVNLGQGINSSRRDNTPSISADNLELYFASDRANGYGNYDLWVTTRSTTDDPWGIPVNLGPTVNNSNAEASPDISADGLSLYFDAGQANRDIWVAERAAKDQPWGTPVKLGPNVNRATWQFCPSISPDGLHLYFDSEGQSTAWGIWMSSRQIHSEPWQQAVSLGSPIDSSYDESAADISIDGLAMFFHSNRPGGYGDQDLYVTTRTTIDANWGIPMNLGPNVNTAYSESDASVSVDGRMLYFAEYPNPRPGGMGDLDIWQAPIIPIVDFNGDGIVGSDEMCIMVDHWGEDYSLCDIGPMPWGDGVVDVEDLKVLAEHLFEQVSDPTLVAHWPLDESQDEIAYDSVSDCDGTLMGGPVWQSEGGMIDGALQFDGIDDYIRTEPILNPADGAFSVLAWIKGGAPGQVILSQAEGLNWLCMDTLEGCIMTDLKGPDRFVGPLLSQAIIADGNWHRIGFVWDGSHRTLYVDGVIVAQDVHNELVSSENGLYIGCDTSSESDSFFSGLIDDVRIYNRVVNP